MLDAAKASESATWRRVIFLFVGPGVMSVLFKGVKLRLSGITLDPPLRRRLCRIVREPARRDRRAGARDEILVVEKIDDRQKGPAERLPGPEQVMQVGA